MSDVLPVLVGRVPKEIDSKAVADEAIEAAFKLIHDRFKEAGFEVPGDVTPGETYVLEAVGQAFVGMVAANLPSNSLKVGDRVKLTRTIDRYPHFIAHDGLTGTVTEVGREIVSVKMDEHLDGAEEWANEIHWYPLNDDEPLDDLEVI